MLSVNNTYQDVNHSQSHFDNKLQSNNQLGMPRGSQMELDGRGSTFNEIQMLNVKSQNEGQKSRFSRNQKICMGISLLLVIGAIVGGVVAYKVLSGKDDNDSEEEEVKADQNYGQYEKEIKAGQENNLITLIHIPNSERQYTYKVTNKQKVQNKDNTKVEDISLTSKYKFGVICLSVNQQEFDMVLYFKESSIPQKSDNTIKIQDYPPPSDQNTSNFDQMQKSIDDDDFSSDISQNKNEMSALSKEEIDLLMKQNVSAKDFMNSNLPIIKFKINKIGKVTEIQKPLNLRYDINSILMNLLEQISPIVSKNYYNVNGKNRFLQTYQRVLQNNVPVNMNASVDNSFKGKLDKSYEDNQKTAHSNTKTTYSQSSEFKDGALKQSNIESNVYLNNFAAEVPKDSNTLIFNVLQVDSKGSIEVDEKIDAVDPEFLKKMLQEQSQMLTLKLTWEQAVDLFNKVRSSGDNSAPNSRLLENEANVGREIRTPIFRNSYASIDFGADLVQSCTDSAFDYLIKCKTSILSSFHSLSQPVFERSLYKPYIPSDKDIGRNVTYYIKNNLANLMGSTKQKVDKQFSIALSVLDGIISRHESFKTNKISQIVGDVKKQQQAEQTNLSSKVSNFDAQMTEYLQGQKDASANWTDTYNKTFQKEYTTYLQNIDSNTNAINAFLDKSYDSLSDLINRIVNGNKIISGNTYNNLKYMMEYYPKAISDTLDEKLYSDFRSVSQNANKLCNSFKDLFSPYIAQLVQTYQTKWQSFDQEYNVNVDKISGFANLESQNVGDIASSGIFYQYGCEAIQKPSNIIESTIQRYSSIGRQKSSQFEQLSQISFSKITKDKINNNLQSDEFTDESANLKKQFETSPSIKKDFTQITNNIIASTSGFLEDGKVIASKVKNQVQAHQERLFRFYFTYTDDVKLSYLNMKQKLEAQKELIVTEYTDYVNTLSQGSERALSNIGQLYSEVFSFIENKNYPSESEYNTIVNNFEYYKLINQKNILIKQPPADKIYNEAVYGINDVYLKNKINDFTQKLEIIYQFSQATEDLQKVMTRTLSDMFDFLNTNMIAKVDVTKYIFFSGYEYNFKKYMSFVFIKQDKIIKDYLTEEFSKPNQSVVKASLYPKVGSFVKKDIETSLVTAILKQQEYLNSKYDEVKNYVSTNYKSTAEKNFGDQSAGSLPYSTFEIKSNYNYVYPTPVGINIKLNLKVQWTIGYTSSYSSEQNTFTFTSINDVKSVLMGTFSTMISTTEIGGLASGKFIDASVTSKSNYNTKNETGDNNVDAKYAPTNIQIVWYMMNYIPRVMTDCSDKQALFKPQTNGIKSSISSIISAGSQISGSKPDDKCQSVVTSTSMKSNILQPVEVQDDKFQKIFVNETYTNKKI